MSFFYASALTFLLEMLEGGKGGEVSRMLGKNYVRHQIEDLLQVLPNIALLTNL